MKKDIKDYLHLYHPQSGLKLQLQDGRIGQYEGITSSMIVKVLIGGGIQDEYANNIKPILRPLSSMTEEEAEEIEATKAFQRPSPVHQIGMMVWTAESYRLLLSKGFDLFGLIDSGLAVTAETLK